MVPSTAVQILRLDAYQSTRSTLNYYSAGDILGDGFQPEDTGVTPERTSATMLLSLKISAERSNRRRSKGNTCEP